MTKAIQPVNVAAMERTAAIARSIRNTLKVNTGLINRRPASTNAGMEKMSIGLQAMSELGNRNGREAIKMAVSRMIASEE